jgi:hypothetical protein
VAYTTLGKERHAVWNPFKSRKYQVVLEFHGDDPENFERVIALETKLEKEIESGEVDGNDVGQGIVNIFIITKEPQGCFEEAMRIVAGAEPAPRAAGYRDLEKDDYIRLWPKGDSTPFELK